MRSLGVALWIVLETSVTTYGAKQPSVAQENHSDGGILAYVQVRYSTTDAPVWVWRSDGCNQCEKCLPIEEVVAQLKSKGVTVLDAQHRFILEMTVCMACHACSSGQEYGVLVGPEDAGRLSALGWSGSASPVRGRRDVEALTGAGGQPDGTVRRAGHEEPEVGAVGEDACEGSPLAGPKVVRTRPKIRCSPSRRRA